MLYDRNDVKVKLLFDMTRYDPSLKAGAIGRTRPPVGQWSSRSNKFVSVQFEEVTVDVQWHHLTVVDEEIVAFEKEDRAREDAMLRSGRIVEATKTVHGHTPRQVRVVWKDEEGKKFLSRWDSREDVARVLGVLDEAGVEVEERQA